MKRWFYLLPILACVMVTLSTSLAQPAQATTIPTVTATLNHNSSGYDYFNPTYPACVKSPTFTLKIRNATNRFVGLTLYNGTLENPYSVAKGKTLTLIIAFNNTVFRYYRVQLWTVEQHQKYLFIAWC